MYNPTLNNTGRKLHNKQMYEGTEHKTSGGICKIIKYNNSQDVVVEFLDGYIASFQLSKILKGCARNPYHENFKLYGIGVCDIKTKGHEREYTVWSNLLWRTQPSKKVKSYTGTSICESWLIFSNFLFDYKNFAGYEGTKTFDWHLDKDILFEGNQVYSKETCCLVPREINNLLIHRNDATNNSKLGVHWNKSKNLYIAQLSTVDKRVHLGGFKTEDEAFYAYKEAKESYVKIVASKYKDKVDARVYEKLMSWRLGNG